MSFRSFLLRLALATAAAAILDAGAVAFLTGQRTSLGSTDVSPDIFIPLGHSGPVHSLAWSPDGELLATGGTDALLKLWDPKSGTLLRTIAGHDSPITIGGWSADGQLIATARKNIISLWQPATGALVRTPAQDAVPIQELAWSPDGKLFAGIVDLEEGRGALGSVRIWRADTAAIVTTFGEHFDSIRGVAWSPDSLRLAATGSVLKIWNAGSGSLLPLRSDQNGLLFNAVSFSPDGQRVAEGGDYDLQVWRSDVGTTLWRVHDNDAVIAMSWSPDGQMIATGTLKNIKLRRADTGVEVRTFSGPKERVCAVAWSPDGHTLASSSCEGAVKLWNADTGAVIRDLSARPNSIFAVSWSPDGQTIASGSRDQTVKLWRVSSGTLARTLAGHSGEVVTLSWRPDGGALASGSRDRTAKLWDAQSGSLLRTLAGTVSGVDPGPFYGVFNGVIVAWSPDGRTLAASGFDDRKVKLWRPDSGQLLRTLDTPDTSIYSLSWSPDARTLAAGSGSIQFWNVDSGAWSDPGALTHSPARYVAFRPDGRTLANVGYRGGIELLNVSTASGAPSLTANHVMSAPSASEAAAWSPDGRLFATAHDDGSIQLWDGDTGKRIRNLEGHAGYVLAVAWSPDSHKLVSGGDDATLRIWDVASGEMESVTTLLPNNEWITSLPNNLLYSSSTHGDDYARIRFGAQWKEIFPLSADSYRRTLKKDDVRTRMSDPAPQLRADPWLVAGHVVQDPRLLRAAEWLYGLLILLALVLPWRSHPLWSTTASLLIIVPIVVWTMDGLSHFPAPVKKAPPPSKQTPPQEDSHQPRVNPRDGLKYVWVPPGTFQIGCSTGDTECRPDEKPAHQVTISKEFWMGQTPVTVAAYQRYATANGKHMPPDSDDQGRKLNTAAGNDSLPVVAVAWNEAKAYCEWAWMRLPTEAEWEYAARAGSNEARYGPLDEIAWYAGNSVKPVGQKKPNAWGLYDMLGNVWQWTADQYDPKYYRKKEALDPQGPPDDGTRTGSFHILACSVLRGGSWFNPPRSIRVSAREYSITRITEHGFRCAGIFQQ